VTKHVVDEGNKGLSDAGSGVMVGSHVEVELVAESSQRECLAFDIVPDAEADFERGFLGEGTPLARAILEGRAGDVVPYQMGDITQVRILSVRAGTRTRDGDVETDRQAIIRKAISKSDLADTVRFALTVDQKWGDTDPEGIALNWEETPEEGEPHRRE
jgi:hypothetical protein